MLDAVPAPGRLDEADGVRDRLDGVVLEPGRKGEVEEHLGVRRALDFGIERRVDGDRRSRFTRWKSPSAPLCIQSQRP